jgi:TIR domain
MYNLFVSADSNSWDGTQFILESSRCIREYTNEEISKKYSNLSKAIIARIKRFPCIFSYETGCEKNPKFGLITDIVERKSQVKVEYEIIELEKFISHNDILKNSFDFDIGSWEMNRTHWAIKDINLPKELLRLGIKLPHWTQRDTQSIDITKHHFQVALSFPGEIRDFILPIVSELEREIGPDAYFYDNNYKAQLARPALDTLLQEIYGKRSKLVVVFLCQKYQEKEWCGVEFRAIKEIIMSKQNERIMFIKMDDGEVDGVFKTDGYINGKEHSAKEIAIFIKERIDLLN